MATTSHPHHSVPLHTRVTRAVGADVRLFYGFAIPIAIAVGFIIALAFSHQSWMAAAAVVFTVIALAVVVFGIMGMLDESDEERTE